MVQNVHWIGGIPNLDQGGSIKASKMVYSIHLSNENLNIDSIIVVIKGRIEIDYN